MTTALAEDPAVIRAWLRDRGQDIPARGRLSDEHRDLYARLRAEEDNSDSDFAAGGDEDAPDLIITGGESPPRDDDRPEEEPEPERTPRRARAHTRRGRLSSIAGQARAAARRKPAPGKGRAKPKQPWTPTAGLISRLWGDAARSVPAAMTPLRRVLYAQAPAAGVVLQDAVKGSLPDRLILQPLARAEGRLDAVGAMLGPPLFTTYLMLQGKPMLYPERLDNGEPHPLAGRPVTDENGMYVFADFGSNVALTGLRYTLMSWIRVSHARADEVIARAEEDEQLGREADRMMAWIFTPPEAGVPGERQAEREGREMAMRLMRRDQARPGETIDPTAMRPPGASAFNPMPATGSRG